MATLNADVPVFQTLIRTAFLYDQRSDKKGDFVPAIIFGVASVQGRALGFHAMTEDGAQIARLPIHALCWKSDAPEQPLDHLELWDCFSYDLSVHTYRHLSGARCQTVLKDHKKYEGEYMFTVDWYGSEYAENPGEIGHKCAHIIKLDNGNYAAQPNNRILWADPSFIVYPFAARPDYFVNTHVWKCESTSKWSTEDSNAYFYEVNDEGQEGDGIQGGAAGHRQEAGYLDGPSGGDIGCGSKEG